MIINIKYFLILQLILLPLLVSASNARGRRRPGARTESTAVEEVTEKAAGPDQIAMASRTESSRFGMQQPSSYSTSFNQETENYPYELNLVRPESQFPTDPAGVSQYSFGNEERQVDDVETAEEYVAKAMQMYGSRLQEPIRITAENTPSQNKYDVFEAPEQPETQTPASEQASAPVYEKDPVTRSYDVYDYSTYETVSEQQYEPKFETKYRYQPNNNADTVYVAPSIRGQSSDNDRIQAAASSEIPKEEILKQIEKSVMKYMKEMEADGKIIPTSEPKTNYYKIQQGESTQRIQTTPRPKQSSFQYTSTTRTQNQKNSPKPSQSNEEAYSTSSLHQELSESLAPNVEFIYKIKARAPLQSMQTSRPYSNKVPLESFDHSAALKNMEEFDLSHVVQEERVASKPKLFFNSDIYQDINSLPYKPEKLVISSRPQKTKEHPDYKGYSLYTEAKAEDDSEDSGYPIMNPYQFVFKKEASSPSLVAQSSNWESSHNRPYSSAPQKPQVEYDTYSPKYNNNPEGYGYQHQHSQNHKYQGRHPTKRGKRGGSHPHGKKGSRGTSITKDTEASVALRPPPKV